MRTRGRGLRLPRVGENELHSGGIALDEPLSGLLLMAGRPYLASLSLSLLYRFPGGPSRSCRSRSGTPLPLGLRRGRTAEELSPAVRLERLVHEFAPGLTV